MAKYTAEQIAQWFVNRAVMSVDTEYGEYLSNLKLQKLLFFAQGASFAVFGKPLFNDKLKAWIHGPVVPAVYTKYKVCGANSIQDVVPVELDEDVEALLEMVYTKYGIYSASQLRNMSHKFKSYSKNYRQDVKNIEIPNKDIEEDFAGNEALARDYDKNKKKYLEMAETCYLNSIPKIKQRLEEKDDDFVEVNWKDEL